MKKSANLLMISAIVCSALIFGNGCSKKTVDTPGMEPNGTMAGGTDINYPPAENSGYSESTVTAEGSLDDTGTATNNDQKGALSVNTEVSENSDEYKMEHGRTTVGLSPIYFDFDQASIRGDMIEKMNNNAIYLKQLPNAHVVIEGNCDERGTKDYNIALGQRRALNAKEYLINLGVEPDRIRTVSYGEERPLFIGQDEASYAQNRRDDFIVE